MPEEKLHHGGDRQWARDTFTYQGKDWLDLSTGINPSPFPIPAIDRALYARLPEMDVLNAMKQAAADYYGVKDPAFISAGAGSQAMIQWLPRLRAPGRIVILTPTYQEHAHAWQLAGHEVIECGDLEKAMSLKPDVLVVVHPNNPTGRLLSQEQVLDIVARQQSHNGWLVLDEAFGDTEPDHCMDRMAGLEGLVILRSFGKFFGLAGIRLGISVTAPDLARKMDEAQGLWSVPGPTMAIATAAYRDRNWIEASRARLAHDAERLDRKLNGAGCEIIGGTSLFRLARHERAQALLRHLGNHGIMIRPFPYNAEWLRFGLPHGDRDWNWLEEAVGSFAG